MYMEFLVVRHRRFCAASIVWIMERLVLGRAYWDFMRELVGFFKTGHNPFSLNE